MEPGGNFSGAAIPILCLGWLIVRLFQKRILQIDRWGCALGWCVSASAGLHWLRQVLIQASAACGFAGEFPCEAASGVGGLGESAVARGVQARMGMRIEKY